MWIADLMGVRHYESLVPVLPTVLQAQYHWMRVRVL